MDKNEMLTDEEIQTLILSLTRFRNLDHMELTEEDSVQVITWARHVRLWNLLLQMVLEGKILIGTNEGNEICYRLNETQIDQKWETSFPKFPIVS